MSLFDTPRPNLSDKLFTSDEEMLELIREHIFLDILSFMPTNILSGIFLLGSMAGRQYSLQSDVDINLVLKQGLHRDDYKVLGKQFSGRPLPGSDHPINYHVANYSDPKYLSKSKFAVYDLLTNK